MIRFISSSLFLAVILSCSLLCASKTIEKPLATSLVIEESTRDIEVIGQNVVCSDTLSFRNDGRNPLHDILVAFDKEKDFNVAYLEAEQIISKGEEELDWKTSIPFDAPTFEEGLSTGNVSFYSFHLEAPLQPGNRTVIQMLYVFINSLRPYPDEITQSETQRVLYHDNHYYLSPYFCEKQLTKVRLPSTLVDAYTKEAPTARDQEEDSVINYGPYEDIEPLSWSTMRIHFENNGNFIMCKEFSREIEVSHWGNVAFKENYNLFHAGAKHKGEFSRFDFQRSAAANGAAAVTKLYGSLHVDVRDVTVTDDIGNISGSTMELNTNGREMSLEVSPRFPLFGGWSTAFTLAYSIPLQHRAYALKGGNLLVNFKVVPSMKGMVYERMETRVVLPELAYDIEYSCKHDSGFDWRMESKQGFLDLFPRPVVVFTAHNIVEEHSNAVLVFYKVPVWSLFLKPLALCMSFLAFFLGCMVLARTDLAISRGATWQAAQEREFHRDCLQRYAAIYASRLKAEGDLERALAQLDPRGSGSSSSVGVESVIAIKTRLEATLKAATDQASMVMKELESSPGGAREVSKLRELEAKEHQKKVQLFQVATTKIQCVQKKLSQKEIDSKLNKLEASLFSVVREAQELYASMDFH